LALDESILSTTIVNMQGQVVRYRSKFHIRNSLSSIESASNFGSNYGILVRATYEMLEQFAKIFGKVQTFVSIHDKVKLVVMPMTEINCLLVLTVLPSANTEYIVSKINLLVSGHKQDRGFGDIAQFPIESGTKWTRAN